LWKRRIIPTILTATLSVNCASLSRGRVTGPRALFRLSREALLADKDRTRELEMIRTDQEYRQTLQRLEAQRRFAAAQRAALEAAGLTPSEVETAMEPLNSFHAQLGEEVEWYENVRRRKIPTIRDLSQIGQLL